MDEMKTYQEGQAVCGGELPQAASMAEMLAQMRQIFADRDAEYARMEDAYQKRKESLDAKEASLKETVSGLEDRLSAVTAREKDVREKETELKEKRESLAKEEAALQEAQAKLDKEKTEQWMQVSLLREEARNEKLRSQRLAGEYEEKLSKLPADSPYLSALQGTVESQKEELEKSKEESRQLKAENAYLTRAKQELEDLSQTLPEQQKKDMDSLHALAKKLAEEKESLEKEMRHLKEENQRLQEEKGELFKKLMAGAMPQMEGGEGPEKEAQKGDVPDQVPSIEEEAEPADVLWEEETLLDAETLFGYLKEKGTDARLLHSSEGELVAVTAGRLQIMFSFREPPRFDIRKKQKGGWGMKKLLKRYNENKAGLVFTYDEREEEFIGSGEFSASMSPEDLAHMVYQAARTYFGYPDEGER